MASTSSRYVDGRGLPPSTVGSLQRRKYLDLYSHMLILTRSGIPGSSTSFCCLRTMTSSRWTNGCSIRRRTRSQCSTGRNGKWNGMESRTPPALGRASQNTPCSKVHYLMHARARFLLDVTVVSSLFHFLGNNRIYPLYKIMPLPTSNPSRI